MALSNSEAKNSAAAEGRPYGLIDRLTIDLFPGYFAMVMATGALAIAAFLLDYHMAARVLLVVAIVSYVVLWILTIVRLLRFPARLFADVVDHARGPGFFTLIAGSCIVGSALVTILGAYRPAVALWFLGLTLWVIVMYTFFTAVTIRRRKPILEVGINGAWLIVIVSTQSISILGTLIAGTFGSGRGIMLFVSINFYLLGCMLYLSIITLIFYRLTFVNLTTEDLAPPYWINMGAVAITTLAGSTLLLHTPAWGFITEIRPFLKGFTLFFWVTASWWIPLLFILFVWRHIVKRFPLHYSPQYWAMVFPLTMYTTGTLQFAKAIDLDFLLAIPRSMIFIAIATWIIVSIGLAMTLWRGYWLWRADRR